MNYHFRAYCDLLDTATNAVRRVERDILMTAGCPIEVHTNVNSVSGSGLGRDQLFTVTAKWSTASAGSVAVIPLQPAEVVHAHGINTIPHAASVDVMLDDIRNMQIDLGLFVQPAPAPVLPKPITIPNPPGELPSVFRTVVVGALRWAGRLAPYMALLMLEGDNPNVKRPTDQDPDPEPGFVLWPYAARAHTVQSMFRPDGTLASNIQNICEMFDGHGLDPIHRGPLVSKDRSKLQNVADPAFYDDPSTFAATWDIYRQRGWFSTTNPDGSVNVPNASIDPPTVDSLWTQDLYKWIGPAHQRIGYYTERGSFPTDGGARIDWSNLCQRHFAIKSTIPTTRRRLVEFQFKVTSWLRGKEFGTGTPVTHQEITIGQVYEIGIPWKHTGFQYALNNFVDEWSIVGHRPIA